MEDSRINIIIKSDIVFPDTFVFEKGSVFYNVLKFKDFEDNTCYQLGNDEKHIIEGDKLNSVLELGEITTELFELIKNIDTSSSPSLTWGEF